MAFPVTALTVLRFNYGQFYQQPNLQDLYVSYRFLQHKVQSGGYFVGFGNPNLRPERTTAYEVGVAHQLSDNARLDVTAYYKDVKDLVEIATIPSFPNQFSSYRNRDFATIKGVDIGFKMRPINHISADVSYSLSYAQGTGSVSNSQGNIAWTASQPPKMTSPLDFDQRHKLALNLDYSLGKGEGPLVGRLARRSRTSGSICSTTWRAARPTRRPRSSTRCPLAAVQHGARGPDQLALRALDQQPGPQGHQGLQRRRACASRPTSGC